MCSLTVTGCPLTVTRCILTVTVCRVQDSQVQGRLVRLLCIFLQAALRRAAADVAGLFPELQAFCICFSRIR